MTSFNTKSTCKKSSKGSIMRVYRPISRRANLESLVVTDATSRLGKQGRRVSYSTIQS